MEQQLHIFIDESGTDDESSLLSVAIVLTEDPESLRTAILGLLEKLKHDPEIGKIESVIENGLLTFHYTEDHFEIRNAFINLLPELNFDAYVSFIRKEEIVEQPGKLALILDLLKVLVYPRLQEKYYEDISIVYEKFDEGSATSKAIIESQIQSLQKKVHRETGKAVDRLNITFADKNEQCLSIADYMAAIVKDYIRTKEDTNKMRDTYRRFYLRVAGKLRLINDYTRKGFYSRQNPLV